jgi:hypothetical protein
MWICPACAAEVDTEWDICWNCTRPREGAVTQALRDEPFVLPSEACSRCGSLKRIPDAYMSASPMGGIAPMYIAWNTQPHALVWKAPIMSPLRAQVCGGCGYIEWYARDPELLWEAYRQRDARTESED